MSTVIELAGQRFPTCAVICPVSDDPDEDEFERSLGSGGEDHTLYIPSENGLLFELVFEFRNEQPSTSLWLCARACFQSHDDERWIWLPQGVQLIDGDLHPQQNELRLGGAFWIGADHDWIAETIHRLGHKPFTQPPGPEVKLVPSDYFADRHHA